MLLHFLDLPPEIREKIYILVCHTSRYIALDSPTAHTSFPLNLLLTNSQLYHEVRPFYFSSNAFSIIVRRRNDDWDYFLSPSFLDNRRQIQSLQITLLRWGTKNFFTEALIPVLEDCILNGRLRILEVRINQKHLEFMEGSRNFRALGKLLHDPYLQSGTLKTGNWWDEESYTETTGLLMNDVTKRLRDLELGGVRT